MAVGASVTAALWNKVSASAWSPAPAPGPQEAERVAADAADHRHRPSHRRRRRDCTCAHAPYSAKAWAAMLREWRREYSTRRARAVPRSSRPSLYAFDADAGAMVSAPR